MDITKIYATLVGRVDDAITVIDNMVEEQKFDWAHVVQVREMLRAALLEAEEKYIEMEEDKEEADCRLIILPHSTTVPPESAGQAHPQE